MNSINNAVINAKEKTEKQNQFVTFMIGNGTYGIGVEKVKEIIGMTEITHVPNTAYFMEGVINLRGSVVPVVDMRKKFRMETRKYDNFSVIIIIEVKSRMIGMLVDSVSDVTSIQPATIQSTPNFSADIEADFIKGIGRINENLVIILDSDLIMETNEIESVKPV